MYLASADATARQRLENIAFHAGRLRPSEAAEGLVFFLIDPALAPQWTTGAMLQIDNVQIDTGKRFALTMSLVYASP